MSSRAFNIADHMKNLQGTRTLASGAKIVGADADSIQAPGLLTVAGGGVNANLSTTTGVSHIKMSGTNHTFDFKVVNQPISGATNSTNDDANSDQLAIYNSSTKLWGISEAGYVVNPKVPCFTAICNQSNADYTADPMIFNVILLNNENMYNTSTGRATAPIPGIYMFSLVGIKGTNTSGVGRGQFRVNGADNNGSGAYYPQARGEAGLQYTQMVSVFYVNLSAGDYVSIDNDDAAGMWASSDGQNAPYFSGCLIG